MTHFNYDAADKTSIAMMLTTVAFKLFTFLIAMPHLGTVSTWITIVAAVSTIVYNSIRIRKEVKEK